MCQRALTRFMEQLAEFKGVTHPAPRTLPEACRYWGRGGKAASGA
jgi:hypothetical protein